MVPGDNRRMKIDPVSLRLFVAVMEEASRPVIVGGARYIVMEPGKAEIAFAVIDQYQGQGVGAALMRNLDEVFGENDPKRRRTSIEEIFHEDAVFHDPSNGFYRGHEEIHRIAGVVKSTHPDFKYQPTAPPEEVGDGGRIQWVSARPGERPAYAGTDFIIARDGKIAAVYLFFDKLT